MTFLVSTRTREQQPTVLWAYVRRCSKRFTQTNSSDAYKPFKAGTTVSISRDNKAQRSGTCPNTAKTWSQAGRFLSLLNPRLQSFLRRSLLGPRHQLGTTGNWKQRNLLGISIKDQNYPLFYRLNKKILPPTLHSHGILFLNSLQWTP